MAVLMEVARPYISCVYVFIYAHTIQHRICHDMLLLGFNLMSKCCFFDMVTYITHGRGRLVSSEVKISVNPPCMAGVGYPGSFLGRTVPHVWQTNNDIKPLKRDFLRICQIAE